MGLVVKMPLDTDKNFGGIVAQQVAKLVLPSVQKMVEAAVKSFMPSEGMTQRELCKRLGYKTNVANPDFQRMAFEVLPHYGYGKSVRWDRQAVDKVLADYTE